MKHKFKSITMASSRNSMILTERLLPLVVAACAFALSYYLISSPPSDGSASLEAPAKVKARKEALVETITVSPQSYQVSILSHGTVQSSNRVRLMSQVEGSITYVSEKFQTGATADVSELLIKVDSKSLQAAVDVSQAELSKTGLALTLVKVDRDQARLDRKRMNKHGSGPKVTALDTQYKMAREAYKSAEAALKIAKINLEKSEIRAPFSGKILDLQQHRVGQYVPPNVLLGEIYAERKLEVRLPLSAAQLANIPGELTQQELSMPTVLSHTMNSVTQHWDAVITRIENEIDPKTRRQYATARLRLSEAQKPPVIGQFVSANISVQRFENVFVIPSRLISDESTITLVVNNSLLKTPVNVLYQNGLVAVIDKGLEGGEAVVTQSLGDDFNDMELSIITDDRGLGEAPRAYGLSLTPESRKPRVEN